MHVSVIDDLNQPLQAKSCHYAADGLDCKAEIVCDIGTGYWNKDGITGVALSPGSHR
jgi:hypothetical protein